MNDTQSALYDIKALEVACLNLIDNVRSAFSEADLLLLQEFLDDVDTIEKLGSQTIEDSHLRDAAIALTKEAIDLALAKVDTLKARFKTYLDENIRAFGQDVEALAKNLEALVESFSKER
jgi:hypothetical protein